MKSRLGAAIAILVISLLTFFWSGAYFALALAVLLAIVITGGFFYTKTAGAELHLKVMGSEEGRRGDDVPFRIEIANNSRMPILAGNVDIELKNDFTGEAATDSVAIGLGPKSKERIEIPYKSEYCGRIRAVAKEARVSDPLRLFGRKKGKKAEGRAYIMPSQESLELDDDRLRAFDQESYKYSPYKKGDDPGEVFAIREYEAGDALRKIHWKLSGKLGQLQIKESGFPEDNDIIILLNRSLAGADTSENSGPEDATDANRGEKKDAREVMDKAGDLVASLSKTLVDRQIPHTLAWYNRELKEMEFYPISSVEDMGNAIKEMLKTGFSAEEESVIINYLSEREIPKAQHLYISEDEKDVDKLRGDGEVTIFRPTAYS